MISSNQNVLRFDVPMENALLVYVVDSLQQLVHVQFYFLRREVVLLQTLIQVLVHELEHKGKLARRLVVEQFD